MKFKAMFKPIQIGPMNVPNRFVVPPMGNNFANTDGTMSEQSAAYYAERAKGGFGLITIEATVVHPDAKGGPRKPCLYDDSMIESFQKVIEACHRGEGFHPASECRAGGKCEECRGADQGGIIHLHTVWKRYPADTDNRGNLSPGRWLCRCCGASLEGRRGCRGSSHGAWVSGEFIPFSTDQ